MKGEGEREREGGREEGRDGEMDGRRERGKEGRREGGKERGREGRRRGEYNLQKTAYNKTRNILKIHLMLSQSLPVYRVRLDRLPLPCIALVRPNH